MKRSGTADGPPDREVGEGADASRPLLSFDSHADLLDEFAAIVGEGNVLTDPDLTIRYGIPWGGSGGVAPLAVVRPLDAGEAAVVLRRCSERRRSVVPQGGNTGLVRGAVPREGDLVLSTERMTSCGEVDPIALQVTAGAGLTLEELQRQLEPSGLELPVDLGSRGQATLGGMAATAAGGTRAFRHGTMRRLVVGVEAVLADGTVLDGLRGVVKDTTGYDWASIMVGSEGTLGVITRVRLQLRPLRRSRAAAMIRFATLEEAMRLATSVRDGDSGLEAAEFMLAGATDLVCDELGLEQPPGGDGEVVMLLEARAREDAMDGLVTALAAAGASADAALAEGSETARLWRYREGLGEALLRRAPVVKLDVALPLSGLAAGVAALERAAFAAGGDSIAPYLFGHLLDGNVHVNIGGVDPERFEEVERAVLAVVLSHGGSIGAEHGIGTAKTKWLAADRSHADIDAMRRIKAALDPRGILAPGTLFADADADADRGEG